MPFLLWAWLDTSYIIKEEQVFYKSGPLRGCININSIRKIEKNKTSWTGLRVGLSTKGLIIHYLDGVVGEEIYFSPEDKDAFIAELLKINPEIEVVEKAIKVTNRN